MKINIVTKNPGKMLAAKKTFGEFGIEVNFIEKDYPEIQGENSLEIARFTALQAAKDFNTPVIREDHSLFINALGIPGPYTNYIEKRIPASKLLKILENEKDRTGYFEVATVYAEPSGSTKEYTFQVPIMIGKEEKGDLQSGWNRVICLSGESRTLAEYPEDERINIWNQNYIEIAKRLNKQ